MASNDEPYSVRLLHIYLINKLKKIKNREKHIEHFNIGLFSKFKHREHFDKTEQHSAAHSTINSHLQKQTGLKPCAFHFHHVCFFLFLTQTREKDPGDGKASDQTADSHYHRHPHGYVRGTLRIRGCGGDWEARWWVGGFRASGVWDCAGVGGGSGYYWTKTVDFSENEGAGLLET